MGEQFSAESGVDPLVPDWQNVTLPDTWPDSLNLRNPIAFLSFLRQIFSSKRRPVDIPADMPGLGLIPKYILQEFHNLPNGNYSKRLTRGYITGFDMAMLGLMGRVRNRIADLMKDMDSVVDIGCGGGHLAGALKRAGIADVWGVDPSPYLLQHAATDYPDIQFVQGIAENTGFSDQRFDGVAVCFLMHEVPPKYIGKALAEFRRILKPGGLLSISEPSAQQFRHSWWALLRKWGWRGLYFRGLAHTVYEPFVEAWHQQDIKIKLNEAGFEWLSDDDDLPIRQILAKKI